MNKKYLILKTKNSLTVEEVNKLKIKFKDMKDSFQIDLVDIRITL